MQSSCRKLVGSLAALAFCVPAVAMAQTETVEEPDKAAAAAEGSTDGHPESSESAASETAPTSPEGPASGAKSAEGSAAETSIPEALATQKSSREARKEAMRNLSKAYPSDAEHPAATVPVAAEKVESQPIESRTIPAAAKTSERMPRFEHHGYFRTRLNAFGNYDLNTHGTSPVLSLIHI